MAQQANLMQEGVDRINEALRSIDDEFQRVQKDLKGRRQTIEKRIQKRRKSIEKQTRKEVGRLRSEFDKNPLVRRARTLQKDVNKQVEASVDNLLGLFQIASKSDMERIDRKLSALGRRIKEIEKVRETPEKTSAQSA